MSVMLGVISYLPDNELRTQRLTAARTQIEWLKSLFNDTTINVVAQGYRDDECNIEGVSYIRYEKGIGAGNARNVLLKAFYQTSYDWLFICDDDTILDNKYDYEYFIQDIINNPTKFELIDAVSAVEPEYHPYKKLNYQDKANLTHYKFEPRELNSGSATSIIRNIKLYYDKELYFPDINANTGEGREDMEFLFSWLKAGFTWYTMVTMIRKSLCFDKSSIFGYNVKERDKILMQCLDNICKRYAKDGITRGVNGQITWRNFNEKYNRTEKVLYIKREVPIEFKENVIPKEKVSLVKKLF